MSTGFLAPLAPMVIPGSQNSKFNIDIFFCNTSHEKGKSTNKDCCCCKAVLNPLPAGNSINDKGDTSICIVSNVDKIQNRKRETNKNDVKYFAKIYCVPNSSVRF